MEKGGQVDADVVSEKAVTAFWCVVGLFCRVCDFFPLGPYIICRHFKSKLFDTPADCAKA